MAITELKFGGLGGQGVILAGMIVGKASAIFDDRHSTLTQAFGPEARGSACSAQVIISDRAILYPYVVRPDILTVMSQDAFVKFAPELREDGVLLYEESLVKVAGLPPGVRTFGIPATRIAEELGRRMVQNIVMVGFFTAATRLIGAEAARQSVRSLVPPGTEELNLQAFERGLEFGRQLAD